MEYRKLDQAEYDRKLRLVVVGAEGLHARSQDVGDGKATIGWGYTFNRNNNVDIWRNSGIELTQQQWSTLERIDSAKTDSEKTKIGLTFTKTVSEEESDKLLRVVMSEYESPAKRLNMPLSDERIALVSLTYNRGVGVLNGNPAKNIPEHPVMDAIRNGNRAEAWFQMRYNCWGSKNSAEAGLRKRRFAESQIFGLYDDVNNLTLEEAQNVYRMYQLHREEIDRVERNFGVTIDGVKASNNRIAQANRDYPELIAEYGAVSTIASALSHAHDVLLQDLRNKHPNLKDKFTKENFRVGEIYIDPGRELQDTDTVERIYSRSSATIRREQKNASIHAVNENRSATINVQSKNNSLLIGAAEEDVLRSHKGNDVLIGGGRQDRMEGGDGHDVYIVGSGDTVLDSDGNGEIHWGEHRLVGGMRLESDPPAAYRSKDGRFTYTLDGNRLSIVDTLGKDAFESGTVIIENFQNGQMGIELSDNPWNPPLKPDGNEVIPQPDGNEVIPQPDGNEVIPQPHVQPDDRHASQVPDQDWDNMSDQDLYAAILSCKDSAELGALCDSFAASEQGRQIKDMGEALYAQQQLEQQQQAQQQQVQQQSAPVIRI